MIAPRLETPRLILRAHTRADWNACSAMWANADVARYIGGAPSPRDQTWRRLLTYAGLWSLLGYGYWAVEERATGAFVGDVGFADFKRVVEPPLGDAPEMGWALAPHAHGRGLAEEAVRAGLAWADHKLKAPRVVCMISPENAPSLRLAEKVGFAAYARTEFAGAPTILFERLR